ncbi:uncharacterized protein LAESUDRAFT_742583 [Laetiporus sulphureus 93-53]|uniref:Nudix hydrolase domain-containing protein n=1 Tax=Laetiporus sulphureus 93-53 TaxID=1314785 RepID=A0A165F141_9APHY|nr:uncharacterized protein LAESUDRAFT_742583 [Laetiporus sulphureus 93-53]KZT08146.1 hypothetical protein LAESUDRAFT_742583 [Laetiporus sulphureus 93-53]
MALPSSATPRSFLDILNVCDNYRINSDEPLATWCLSPEPGSPAIGLLRPEIVEHLRRENAREGHSPPWVFELRGGKVHVSFSVELRNAAARTRVMKGLCERWRDEGLYADVIGPRKWRGEKYPVYRDPFGRHDAPAHDSDADNDDDDGRNYAFMMERAACALFGVVTYGVHMTIYEEDRDEDGLPTSCRVWVPKRARTKQTWPGYLDNTVAGGISSGLGVFESLVKESMEEASLAEGIIRRHARAVGTVSYFFRTGAGRLQPEVEYLYDLRVPSGADRDAYKPKPLDGEVESFELLSLGEVVTRIRAALFKPNTALVLLDFMIRHGYLTPDEEPDYQEIVTRLHGRFDYDKW